MWIMVSGPYSSGATTADARERNLRALHEAALAVLRRGHVPVVGVTAALPLVDVAGPEAFDEVVMPLSLALAERCDACLRLDGPSRGADEEVERFLARDLPVFRSVEEVPPA